MGQDIVKTHKRLLAMAQEIKKIFEKNNVTYSITFGTLIGAVRHQGFIPWDDDFDFIIFKDEYTKAIDALRDNLPSDFFLEDSFIIMFSLLLFSLIILSNTSSEFPGVEFI